MNPPSSLESDNGAAAMPPQQQPQEDLSNNWPMRKVVHLDENDVTISKDSPLLCETQNPQFCKLLYETCHHDATKLSCTQRPLVALELLQTWRKQNPPGRFLKYDEKTRLWNDIGDKKAREKISKALKKLESVATDAKNSKSSTGMKIQQRSVSFSAQVLLDNHHDASGQAAHCESPTGDIPARPPQASPSSNRSVSTNINYARQGQLYGRSTEKGQLTEVFHRLHESSSSSTNHGEERPTCAPADLVVISGDVGTGKTALAESLRPIVLQDGGFFLQGKFEQLEGVAAGNLAPFAALLTDLTHQLKRLPEEKLQKIREAIVECLGNESRLLTNLVPALQEILVTQNDKLVAEAGQGAQAVKRFEFAFRLLLRAIASPDSPVVFLLDDLHWASTSALDVFSAIVADTESHGIMFVATCRTTTSDRAINTMIKMLSPEQARITRIKLGNLKQKSVHHMLSQSLSLASEEVNTLSQTAFSLTNGNIFFLLELLRSFQDSELLHFDDVSRQWVCDSHLIKVNVGISTVVDLFKAKIADLDRQVQDALKVASCFGSKINEPLLQKILSEKVVRHIDTAASSGLLVFDDLGDCYRFAHDGIQEAAYSLIPPNEKESYHLRMGRQLWKNLDESELDDFIIPLVGQLVRGDRHITDDNERAHVSELCLQAGEKAIKSTGGFEAATVHFHNGLSLLGPRKWRDNYELTLRLYNEKAEACYCTANFLEVTRLVEEVFRNARSFDDTLQARATQIYALGSRGLLPDAIEKGVATLEILGEPIPLKPTPAQASLAMWRTQRKLRRWSDNRLVRLPAMNDPKKLAAMQIFNLLFLSTLYARPLLTPIIVCRMVRLTIMHGISAVSCLGFATYGMVLCGGGAKIEQGYRYGRIAMQMYEQVKVEAWFCRVSAIYHGCVRPWREPLGPSLAPLKYAYRSGLISGDVEYAMLNASIYCWNCRDSLPLPVLDKEIRNVSERMEFLGQSSHLLLMKPLWQTVQNFQGPCQGDPKVLTGRIMDHEETVRQVKDSNPSMLHWTRFHCMLLAFYFGDYELAEAYSRGSNQIYDNNFGAMDTSVVLFYELMSLLASAQKNDRRRMRYVRRLLKRLTGWARNCPTNFMGKQYLVEAEINLLRGEHLEALAKYSSSILHSREGGFLVQEALGNERMAKLHLARGEKELAAPIFKEACRLYEKWGGIEKLQHLQEEVPTPLF